MLFGEVRRASQKVFGNAKFVEVVLALARSSHAATAQQISRRSVLGDEPLGHSQARDVLVRLADAGLLQRMPRANERAAQYYLADRADPRWRSLVSLAEAISGLNVEATTHVDADEGQR